MKMGSMLGIGALGLGAYFLLNQQAQSSEPSSGGAGGASGGSDGVLFVGGVGPVDATPTVAPAGVINYNISLPNLPSTFFDASTKTPSNSDSVVQSSALPAARGIPGTFTPMPTGKKGSNSSASAAAPVVPNKLFTSMPTAAPDKKAVSSGLSGPFPGVNFKKVLP